MIVVLSAMFGWCGLREGPHVYKIDKVRCFCLICGYGAVITLVHVIYVRVNPGELKISEGRNQQIAIAANALALCLFVGGTYFSKMLYDELRLNYSPPEEQYAAPQGLFGPSSGPSQATQANGNNVRGRFVG